jgi:hypothetical protein
MANGTLIKKLLPQFHIAEQEKTGERRLARGLFRRRDAQKSIYTRQSRHQVLRPASQN